MSHDGPVPPSLPPAFAQPSRPARPTERPCIRRGCSGKTLELFCPDDWKKLPRPVRQELIRVRDVCRDIATNRGRGRKGAQDQFHKLLIHAVQLLNGAIPLQAIAVDQPVASGVDAKDGGR